MILQEKLTDFEKWLREEEKSDATIEKYLRDVERFLHFLVGRELTKEAVLEYKAQLGESYAVSGANSMIAAINSFLRFCGADSMCVKQFRVQRQTFCSEDI